jgi:hypothetical protein
LVVHRATRIPLIPAAAIGIGTAPELGSSSNRIPIVPIHGRGSGRSLARFDRSGAVILVAASVALVLRGYRLTRPGVLFGEGADDGVYFLAAVRLVHGAVPYRDYVLVHPPLITVLLAPFALLGKLVGTADAFAVARLATAAVGAADVALIGLLLRRFGTGAVVVGCTVLALHGSAVVSAETIYLEPYLVLLVLAALLVLFDGTELAGPRRQLGGSVLIGLACATKIWAVVPALVLALIAVLFPARGCRRRGQLGRVASGATAGFVLPVLPFAVLAPTRFVQDVFVAQLQRRGPRSSVAVRVASLLGLGSDQSRPAILVLVAGVALAVGVIGAYGRYVRRCRGRLDAFTVFVVVSAALVAVMFFIPVAYFWHYGGFFAPFLGLSLARPMSAGAAATWLPARRAITVVAAGFAVVFAFGSVAALSPVEGTTIPVTRIDAHIPPGSCVVTNNSSIALIVDRVNSASRCPQVVDPFGVGLVYAHVGTQAPRDADRLVAYWDAVLARSQYLLLISNRRDRLPWHSLRPVVECNFHRVPLHLSSPQFVLWLRNAGPRGQACRA